MLRSRFPDRARHIVKTELKLDIPEAFMRRTHIATFMFVLLLAGIVILIACGGGSNNSSQTGFVNTVISDPAPCTAPTGPFSAVWITVTDVQIHNSSTGKWVDLTPGLAPTQVNLLNQPSTECFLAQLGSKTELQAGSYEQIRINLADTNDHSVKLQTANACGTQPNAPLNCVATTIGNVTTFSPLLLSSEDKNGIKIPSGQIAGGNFTIAGGQTNDLDIDFNSCASVVTEGNGQYRLKPVLHAGEVALNSAVNGKAVDAGNSNLPVNGTVLVALENREGNTDRVFLSAIADANGNFALCPVPAGTYDLVAVAISKSGVVYAATVLTGIQAGTVVGNVPLFPETTTNTGPATISGNVTTVGSGEDVLVSALQQVNDGTHPAFFVTVPSITPLPAATFTLPTDDSPTCTNSLCTFEFGLPGVNPAVAVFGSTISYTQSSGATYIVDALPLPTTTQVCSKAEVQSGNITLHPGGSQTNVSLGFSGCTPPPPSNQ